ncbi:MAG TPA: ABC transporter ATP-binding protein [Clostridiales bacterium]|nr:ABC transporter ATP-binding protein [Clostridiales bacterium]
MTFTKKHYKAEAVKNSDKQKKISFIRKYIKNYWVPFLLAIVFLALEAFCDLMQPTIMSKIIDIGVAGKNVKYVISGGGLMLAVTALGAIAAIIRNIVSSNVSQKFGCELRADLFKKIQTFSFDNIDKFEPASLITRLTNDVTQVQHFVHGTMRIFVKAPILCIGSFIMAWMLNPRMTVVLLVVVPIITFLIIMSAKIGYPFFAKVQKAIDDVNAVTREYLSGVRVVKAFNRFDYEKERFESSNRKLTSLTTTTMRIMTVFSPGMSLAVNLGIAAVLWMGGIWVNYGQMNVGKIIAFINYMTQLLHSLMMISFVFNMFVRSRASTARIKEVFAQENTIPEPVNVYGVDDKYTGIADEDNANAGNASVDNANVDNVYPDIGDMKNEVIHENATTSPKKAKVEFEDVSFLYAGASGEPVIKNVSFTCMPGETVGIIGSTGSGKTTLVNLIPRFYDVTYGSVKIDGVDVRDIPTKKLRHMISIVPQKTILFTGTIIDNIKWGKDYATFGEIEEAASAAQAHNFISAFPEGYDTLLGQGGVNLSGGQKQRVSIARALVKKPQILILDDCTSAVDVATEAAIRKALKERSESMSCTVFIIAQRITSVMRADKILVLEDGALAGIGTHDELLKTCSVYHDIYHSQMGEDAVS